MNEDRPSVTATTQTGTGLTGLNALSDDLSGKVLGNYRLVRKVAAGGMGEVYEAIQSSLDRKVAVKVLSSQLALMTQFIQRFEREAKAAAALNHPNVVQVHDFGDAGGRLYIAMEYVEGDNLSDYVRVRGKLSIEEGLSAIEQTALALKAALEKSIIHRDIKPGNLLRLPDRRVKVADLGLAKILTENSDVTGTGASMGTPHFLAPEQAQDARQVDHRADIYSLGLTLLYLLTGRKPYEGASSYAVVLAHTNKPLPTGEELGTPLPESVETFIRRMAAKDPNERYPDYDALLADLNRAKTGLPPVPFIKLPPKPPKARKLVWMAAIPVAALLAAAVMFLTAPPLDTQPKPPMPKTVVQRPPDDRPGPPNDRRGGDGPPDQMGSQDGPFRGPRGYGPPPFMRNRFGRLPMPPNQRPNFAPLRDGSVAEMLADADKLATTSPQMFILHVNAYRQVADRAAGTPDEARVNQKLDTAIARHQAAAGSAITNFTERMQASLRANRPQEAFDMWRDFPPMLRTREADEEILKILEAQMPKDFRPSGPPGGQGGPGGPDGPGGPEPRPGPPPPGN